MPQIKPGHRLYLYRLFSRELGRGKQTNLTRAAEVLESDGLSPLDLGFDDIRSLLEALDECAKLTVFKKGAVFVTIVSNEEYDAALARAEKGDSQKAPAGKPWKQKRGAKNIKPLRPKHIEPKVEAAGEPEVEAEPEAMPEPEVQVEPVTAPEPEPVTVPKPVSSPTEEPQASLALGGGDAPVASREASEERSDERRAVGRAVAAEGEGRPAAEDAEPPAGPEPSIHLTITYAPEPVKPEPEGTAAEPEPAPETAPEPACVPQPAPAREPARPPRPSRPANDLPQDFYADVIVTDEPLSALYQVLPIDVDPVATLEEDFRIARSTGALKGTRSEVSFPLRFRKKDGSPVAATLRRRARAIAGKRWALTGIDADAPEEVGMGALAHKAAGAWAAFSNNEQLKGQISPEDELAQFAVLGSWDKLLDELASLAEPEDWGEGRAILREYLAMTFRRVQRQHRLSMADDGSGAAFDTGLVTAAGEPIGAILEPHDGDIAWELTCFSINAQGRAASYPSPFAETRQEAPRGAEAAAGGLQARASEIARPLHRALQRAERNPRYATLAYDAVADRVAVLLPVEGKVAALVPGDDGEPQVAALLGARDAYVCARVVSSEQPGWLVRMAKESE